MKNLGLRAFSLAIALGLSWYVTGESNTIVRTFSTSVEVRQLPPGKMVVSPLNANAQVTIKGPSFLVSRIPLAPPVFSVGFPSLTENLYLAQLESTALALPPRVEVLTIEPPEINFVLDDEVTKALKVEVPRTGALDDNLKITEIRVIPTEITVTGPDSQIRSHKIVETDPIDLRGITGTTTRELSVRTLGPLYRLSTDRVSVEIDVAPVTTERRFESIPIEVRTLPGQRFQVQPAEVHVIVAGPPRKIGSLKRSDVVAFVRVPELVDGKTEMKVSSEVPAGFSVTTIDPGSVEVIRLDSSGKSRAAQTKRDATR